VRPDDDDDDNDDDDDDDDMVALHARFFSEHDMLKDTKLSTSTHVALNAPEPGNSNGTAVYTPVLTPKDKPTTAATRVFVFGNCPTRPNGLGNNVSKLGLGSKAAGIWGRNLGQIGGKATISSHGQQLGNGGRATIKTHGVQMGNGGRKSSRLFP